MNARIIHNEEIAPGYFRMGLRWKTPEVRPGQFVMVRVTEGLDPLLRRPFGIYDVLGAKGKGPLKGTGIELVYRVVGKGTLLLSEKKPGEEVDVLGPLGNGFIEPTGPGSAVIVGGGMGIVPLYLFARRLKGSTVLFGGRSRNDVRLVRDFKGQGLKVKVATEDGSVGMKGFVTALLPGALREGSVVYACGPAGMLKAVAKAAEERDVRCYVSLERSMACGIGVCLGCAVKTRAHEGPENRTYRMVCSDGPVFDSSDIDWERF